MNSPFTTSKIADLIDYIESALEQAQDCINDETPEYGTDEEAKFDTLVKVRTSLVQAIPALRANTKDMISDALQLYRSSDKQ